MKALKKLDKPVVFCDLRSISREIWFVIIAKTDTMRNRCSEKAEKLSKVLMRATVAVK